jgi:hypothetical protein
MAELAIVLSNTQIQKIDNEYEKLVEQSHFDNEWNTDYQAALRAPAAFMLNKVTNFEATFDRIIFHLDESIRKSDDKDIQRALCRTADDMFSRMIHLIQNHIDLIKKENEKGFFEKFTNSVSSIVQSVSNPSSYFKGAASLAINIAPEVGNMFKDFLVYFNQKLQLEKNETIFYNQLSHVYQKILDSECYNPEFGLIRNTFTRNKEEIIRHVVYQKGLNIGKNLMKFDKTETEKQDTVRIINNALAESYQWDSVLQFLTELKEGNYKNYNETERLAINNFREIHKQKILQGLKNIFRANLKANEQKLLDNYVFDFTLKINGSYHEHAAKAKKMKMIKMLSTIIFLITLLICTITFKEFQLAGLIIITLIFCFSFYGGIIYFILKKRKQKIMQKLIN